jgi:sulfoxide reductase heme-binding subunit YedZ
MKIRITRIQFLCHVLCVSPLVILLYGTFFDQLTANPIREINILTGRTAITILLISLLCTPFNNILGLSSFLSIRRTLGLYAAFYALLHFANFIGLDYSFNWGDIGTVIQQQPFLIIGLTALILLIPLVVTSLPTIQKSLGKCWKKIHLLIYLIVILVIFHFFLAVKASFLLPKIYLFLYIFLMLLRIPLFSHHKISTPAINGINIFLKRRLFEDDRI